MQYRLDKYGNKLSILGFGCMRFKRKLGKLDLQLAEKQLKLAIDRGVNYLDTAYIYPGSEAALGVILERTGLRDKVYIATKLPHYLIRDVAGAERIFTEELKRLRTDHIDYYLMHMLNDVASWQRLKDMGILQWLEEKKRCGQIRQVGFSYHGNTENFCRLLDAYDWDFCQIQYNYLDEHTQAGRTGLRRAYEKGLPVIIMEPLRGGKLVASLPHKARQLFADHQPQRSPAEWGLRWLWDQEEVTVVLSGMNSGPMIMENIRTASTVKPGALTQEDFDLYRRVVEAINETTKVRCTGCGYCQPCPKGVDIPGIFAIYDRWYGEDKFAAFLDYLKCTTLRKNATAASNCVGCGKCEKHCPQGIQIRKELQEVQKALETPLYRGIRKVVKRFGHF